MLDCPTYISGQIYTCQPPEVQPGQARGEGCDIGCTICDDLPVNMLASGVLLEGRRWLLPNEARQPRDAHGALHDMRSNQPHQVPQLIDYLRAPCWRNGGIEVHGADVCDCHPGPDAAPMPPPDNPEGPHLCAGGEAPGAPLRGTFPDCQSYRGHHISANAHGVWMDCRGVTEHGDVNERFTSGRFFQTIFARLGGARQCVTNAIVECAAKVPRGQCITGFAYVQTPGPEYYYDSPCRQAFNFCTMPKNSTQILSRGGGAVTAAKNGVLKVVGNANTQWPGISNLRQLDNQGSTRLSNSELDLWSRGVQTPFDVPAMDPSIVVAWPFPNSRLKNAGCSVMAELFVASAQIEMSLAAYKINMPQDDTPVPQLLIHPHARVHITAKCGVRAWFPDTGCVLVKPWIPEGEEGHTVPLVIINPGGTHLAALPRVVAAGGNNVFDADEIIYVDEGGSIVEPPLFVEWWGYLGAFSAPPTEDRFEKAEQCSSVPGAQSHCQQLLAALSGMQVPGWPASTDSEPHSPNTVYTGNIEFDFRNDTYFACCDG